MLHGVALLMVCTCVAADGMHARACVRGKEGVLCDVTKDNVLENLARVCLGDLYSLQRGVFVWIGR